MRAGGSDVDMGERRTPSPGTCIQGRQGDVRFGIPAALLFRSIDALLFRSIESDPRLKYGRGKKIALTYNCSYVVICLE